MTSVSIFCTVGIEASTLAGGREIGPSLGWPHVIQNASPNSAPALPRKGEVTRHELMRAAGRIFEKHGYVNADVAMITQEARKARGTFYIYFPNKPDVLRAMIEDFSTDLRSGVLARGEHRPEEMPAVLERLWAKYRKHASTFRALAEAAAVEAEFANVYRDLRELARRDFLGMMRRSSDGLFTDERDIEMAAAVMETMVCNLMYDWLAAGNARRASAAAEQRVFDVMLRIVSAVMGKPKRARGRRVP